jgi:hypothetical protein
MTMLLLTLSAALVAGAVGAEFPGAIIAEWRIDPRPPITRLTIAHAVPRSVGLIARKKHGGFQLIEPLQRRGGRGAL